MPLLGGTPAQASEQKPGQVKVASERKKPPVEKPKSAVGGTLRERLRHRILSAKEIEKAIAPYVPSLSECYRLHAYKQRRATGHVRLELIIHRNGSLFKKKLVAEGVTGKRFSRCVDKALASLRFPMKKGFTTTTIPFLFLKTNAKGAGPVLSCWRAKGCPSKDTRSGNKR